MKRAVWIMAIIIVVLVIAVAYYFFNPFCGFRTTFSTYATPECAVEVCLLTRTECDSVSDRIDDDTKERINALFENASANQTA